MNRKSILFYPYIAKINSTVALTNCFLSLCSINVLAFESIYTKRPFSWFKIVIAFAAAIIIVQYICSIIKEYHKTNEDTSYSKKQRRNKAIKDIVNLIVPLAVVVVVFQFVIGITVIQSASMEPTLMTGNTVFINRLYYKTGHEVQRGDIVVFKSDEYNNIFGKRVIGLPGDKIEFKNGYVVINGQYCDESAYIDEDIETNCTKTFDVPAGCYFMLGDNREVSNDARYWNTPYIQENIIIGRYMGQIDFSIQYDILKRLSSLL